MLSCLSNPWEGHENCSQCYFLHTLALSLYAVHIKVKPSEFGVEQTGVSSSGTLNPDCNTKTDFLLPDH